MRKLLNRNLCVIFIKEQEKIEVKKCVYEMMKKNKKNKKKNN